MGGTGLVGGHLVRLLAAEPSVRRVLVPVRRAVRRWESLPAVETLMVDFEALDREPADWIGTQVFLALGTTMKKAGSQEAFRRVDLEYTVEAASLAVRAGARDAFLVSSTGADPDSRAFYLRVKGEAEEALAALPFRSVHVFRPSLLTGDRTEVRPFEQIGALVGSLLAPLMVGPLRRHRPIAAETVARAMLSVAADAGEGLFVHESEEIRRLGAGEGS